MSEHAVMPLADYVGACDAIREKTGATDAIKSGEMATQINAVYENGHSAGLTEGQQAENKKWWNGIQHNGTKADYSYAFYFFPTNLFYPEHDLAPINASYMFRQFGTKENANGSYIYEEPIDLAERFESCGVVFDSSKTTRFSQMLAYSRSITRFPIIDSTSATSLEVLCLYNLVIETIDKIILKDDGSQDLRRAFDEAENLRNIEFEGVIGYNAVNFQWSPLTAESAKSAILHLKDFSGTDSEYTCSITFSETTLALLEAEGNTSPSGGLWTDYIHEKGWN